MSPQEGAFILGSLLLTALVSYGTYRSNRLLRELGALPFNPLLAPAENGLKLVLLALVVALCGLSGLAARRFGLVPLTASDLMLGVVVGVGAWALGNLVTTLAMARWGESIVSSLVIRAIMPRTRRQWGGVALAMALAVGLEEALFRALLLGGLGTWLPLAPLVLASSVLFGMLHSIQGSLGVAVTAAMGLGLGVLFLYSGSLWPPLVAHYVINMGQILLATRRPDLIKV